MKTTTILIPLLAATLFSACRKEVIETTPSPVENPTQKNLPTTVDRTQLLQLVNDVRQRGCQCGDTYYYPTTKVSWNSQLEVAAYNHSSDMSKNNYFSHTGLDGSDPGARLTQAGYYWMAYGENIAQGYTSESTVVDAWLKSPGHCRNIMDKNFKEMGVARVGTYWTQELATK